MSIASLSTLSVATSTRPAVTAKDFSVTKSTIKTSAATAPHATHFAQILSHGKAAEKGAHERARPVSDKGDTDQQEDDGNADPNANATDASAVTATSDDLDAAANEGVSAVLALLGSMQAAAASPAPVTPPTTGTDVTPDVISAAVPVRTFAVPTPTVDASAAATSQTPAPTPPVTAETASAPVDVASLSPADIQLLRNMAGGSAPDSKAPATDMTTATDGTAHAPDISPMAQALNQAFGQTPTSPQTQAPAPVAQTTTDPKAVTSASAAPQAVDAAVATDKSAARHAGASDDDTVSAVNVAATDTATPAFTVPSSDAPAPTPTTDASASTANIAPTHAEQSVTRHLDMLHDTQWLDRLAQDISQASAQNGHLKFQLNPEHLGSLAVEITNGAAGASIRMTTDNDHARAIIADAQPRLLAEVRAQGLRIAESHVDLGNQANGGNSAGQRQSSEDHKPFVRTQIPTSEESSDSAPRDDELYA